MLPDKEKTKEQLVNELAGLRRRFAELATGEVTASRGELNKEMEIRKQVEEELRNYRPHLEELVKERTEELQNTREELERILDLSVDIIAVTDLKTGFFTRVNPAFSRIIGYSQEEILSTPFMDFLHPDDRDKTVDVVADELASADLIPHFENRYRCKDGSYKWIAWTSQPLPEEGIAFATGRDITALKDIEMELESHRQHLESLVDERTTELKRTNEKMAVEITERKQAKEQQILSLKVLECLNRGGGQREVVHDILMLVKEFSGCDAVGIRLQEGEDFPYYDTNGFALKLVRDDSPCSLLIYGNLEWG